MESTETLHHTLHPLRDGYIIDEVELDHTIGKDYWLVKGGSDQRVWLSDNSDEAFRLAGMAMSERGGN